MSDRGERQSLLLPILIPVGALAAIVLVLFGFSRVLLSIKPNAATATALSAAVGIMAVAAFVAGRKRVTGAALGGFVGAAAGITMFAGGLAIAVIGPPKPEKEPFPVVIAAPEGAAQSGFSTMTLKVEAATPIALEFDNQDRGVGHNVEIFDGPDAQAPSLFDGPVITGVSKTTYPVGSLPEGEYFFHCKIHPTTMTGTIESAKGAGGVRIVAEGTAFNTDRIELPADTPSTLTFENKDATTHNVSFYRDESAEGEPLFTFDPFAGPATQTFPVPPIPKGEYYFHCDVHPVMNGTVVVAPPPPPGEGGPGEGGPGEGEPGEGGGEGDVADGGG